MNKTATKLRLRNTSFSNPHGLSNKGNKSTAEDISILCCYFIKDEFLKSVTNTKEFISTVTSYKGK